MSPMFEPLHPDDCVLKTTRIDIWQYPLHPNFKNAVKLLSDDELTRAQRFHFPRHQRRFTVARAMLRIILARYLNQSPKELKLTYNKHGKPELMDDHALEFNLSHSGEVALLAVGQQYPLGIDLEFFSARSYQGIGNQLFSPSENLAFHQVNPRLQPLAFFHIWAQKEALIKACGLGLTYPTQQFTVPILPSTNQEIIDTLHKKTWQMISFMPEIACSAALCYDSAINQLRYLKLTVAQEL